MYFGNWELDVRVGTGFYVDLNVTTATATTSQGPREGKGGVTLLGRSPNVTNQVVRATVIHGRWARDELAEVFWTIAGDMDLQSTAVRQSWL